MAVAIAQAGLDAALAYVRDRRHFGKPILENQGLQWMLADMVKDIAAGRALVERAALLIDHNKLATVAASMAKCFASDMAVAQTANAVQVFGGAGYIRGFEVERLYRDAKIAQIYEGTNQIQRTIIVKEPIKGIACSGVAQYASECSKIGTFYYVIGCRTAPNYRRLLFQTCE